MRLNTFYLVAILFSIILLSILLLNSFKITSRNDHNRVDIDKKIENVILIIACSLRADHLGCYGYDRKTSPNIDQLAKEGVLFKNCYVQAPFTVHSIPSIITSKHPRQLFGMDSYRFTIPDQATTFAEIFKANGYVTLGVMANPWVSKAFNFDQGFDYFYDTSDLLKKYASEQERLANRVWGGEITREAIAQVRKSKGRFFLQVMYIDSHAPYQPSPPFKNKFATDTSKNNVVNLYDETILSLDQQIGTLLQSLRDMGLVESTLIIFTADHGEAFGEYHDYDKGHGIFLYDTVIRVPLIFSNPHMPQKGLTIEGYVAGIDILPTTVDVIGIPYDKGQFEGTNLEQQFSGRDGSKQSNRQIISETNFLRNHTWRSCVIWEQRWKLIHNYRTTLGEKSSIQQLPTFELYDLKNDPHELKSLHGQNKESTIQLTKLIQDWQKNQLPTASEEAKAKYDSIDKLPPELTNQLKTLGYIN